MTAAKVAAVTEPARTRHLGGGVLASTVAQVATFACAGVTSILLARILGADGLGAFALAANFAGVSLLVLGLGVKQGILVLVGSDRWPLRFAASDLLVLLIALGSTGAALVFGVYELLDGSALEPIPAEVVPVLAAGVVLGLAWQWSWCLVLARERYESYAAVFAAPTVATLVVSPPLALAWGVSEAIVGIVAGFAAGAAIGMWLVARLGARWRLREGRRGRAARLRSALGFGIQSWGSEVLRYSNMRLDLFFVAAYASAADVGKYSVAVTVATIGLILPSALSTTIMPRTAKLSGASASRDTPLDEADLSDARACRHTVLMLPLTAALLAVLLVVGVPIFYGSEFDRTVELGFILLPGVLLLGVSQVMTSIVQGRGRPDYAFYVVLATAPATAVAYLLVIPDSGATGAAVVSTCSYAATAVVAYFLFRRATGIGPRQALVPSRDELRAYRDVVGLTRDYLYSAWPSTRRR
jgi:O-antigen/teichoic acid export membrane protein